VRGTLFCASRSGFAHVRLDGGHLAAEFRDFAGQKLYAASLARAS